MAAMGTFQEQRRERKIVVSLVSCKEMAGLEDRLSSCVRQVEVRYRVEVELNTGMVVVGNQILQSYHGASATAASSLVNSSSSPPSNWSGGAQGVWAPGGLLEAA